MNLTDHITIGAPPDIGPLFGGGSVLFTFADVRRTKCIVLLPWGQGSPADAAQFFGWLDKCGATSRYLDADRFAAVQASLQAAIGSPQATQAGETTATQANGILDQLRGAQDVGTTIVPQADRPIIGRQAQAQTQVGGRGSNGRGRKESVVAPAVAAQTTGKPRGRPRKNEARAQ